MNNEENRLRTFSDWPSDAVIEPSRIAKGGFFYTGQGLEVECFACGGKISDWNYGDQVMARHRQMAFQCSFVINPSSSGNIPKITTSSTSQTQTDSASYRSERARKDSFVNWPSSDIVTPDNLAKAGFYSLRNSDKVKCAFCGGICGCWERGDDPKAEHRRHFPNCSFVRANFSTSTKTGSTNSLEEAHQMQELGILGHSGPKQPLYATLESRLRSFANWNTDLIQTPEMLAEAGFYYVGTGDQVRCYYCDGGLRHWDLDDVPWNEHARWFPTCAFVILVKGNEFIQTCADPSLNSRLGDSNGRSTPDPLNSAQAQAALSVGISRGQVKAAITFRLQKHGTLFNTADELIDVALKLQVGSRDEGDGLPERGRSSEAPPFHEVRYLENPTEPSRQETSSRPPSSSSKPLSSSSSAPLPLPKRGERPPSPKFSLEEENRQLKEARLCKVCLDNEMGIVFLPCGHLSTCITCAPNLKTCPVCRANIKGTVRTFIS